MSEGQHLDPWWQTDEDREATEELAHLIVTHTPLDAEESRKLAICAVGLGIDWARVLENAALWRDSTGILASTLRTIKGVDYLLYGADYDAAVINAALSVAIGDEVLMGIDLASDFGKPEIGESPLASDIYDIFKEFSSTQSSRRAHLDTSHPRSPRHAPRVLGRK